MRPVSQRRKDFMDYLCKVLDILDPSGENSKQYHDILDGMSDTQFNQWVEKFFNDPKQFIYVEMVEYERELSMDKIEKCAKFMKVPLFERVALPYLTSDNGPTVVTPEPVAVGYVHEKRMQQTLLKKTGGSISISKKNPKTGQVVAKDKNARNTDVETYALSAQKAVYSLKELMGPRADDESAKTQMYNAISAKGYVSLDELEDDRYNKTALNTLDVYWLLQGISTNLITPLDTITTMRTPQEKREARERNKK